LPAQRRGEPLDKLGARDVVPVRDQERFAERPRITDAPYQQVDDVIQADQAASIVDVRERQRNTTLNEPQQASKASSSAASIDEWGADDDQAQARLFRDLP
jgi:hypothetical protein